MENNYTPPPRSWTGKFREAFAGGWRGLRGQSSFVVHFIAGALVIAAGVVLRVTRVEWCLLVLCITIVIAGEMFNTALEIIAKAIDQKYNNHLKEGLNVSSAAVSIAALGAAVTGVLILGYRIGVAVEWW